MKTMCISSRFGLLVLALLSLPLTVLAQTTTRVSVDSAGTQATGDSYNYPSMSADGRFVAFQSDATNLVAGDTNDVTDIFVHDRHSGQTTRVSINWLGQQALGASTNPSISADGRFVSFASAATNLVAGDNNGVSDTFVHDRQLSVTTRISIDSAGAESNADSFDSSISADGRFVAFASDATNLVAGDTNAQRDIFIHDRQTGETTRVSVNSAGAESNGPSYDPSISADGQWVAFSSEASNLVANDINGRRDIFISLWQLGFRDIVSKSSARARANLDSYGPSISADGSFVAFRSNATNLVASDTNGVSDIFVYDRWAGDTTRVSVQGSGSQVNDFSSAPSISADGRFVAFVSAANNLVAGDTNGVLDIFVHDRQSREMTRVSIDSSAIQATGASYDPSISGDGRFVAFQSGATNLVTGDTNGFSDIFVHGPVSTPSISRSNVDSAGAQATDSSGGASISTDGRFVAFSSSATNLVAGDTNGFVDIFLHDHLTGETTRVNVDSAGAQATDSSGGASISADGRFVTFSSYATNLVAGDTNDAGDIFVHDRQTGQMTRVSVDNAGAQANGESIQSRGSTDGRFVSFASAATNLVAGDTNGVEDIFVHDRQTGQTTRVNVDSAGAQANGPSYSPSISADGRFVAFQSGATNLVAGDTNGVEDIFVHDRQTGETTRVNVDSAGAQANGVKGGWNPSISGNGRFVAFNSDSNNLVAGDTNGVEDIFVHDRLLATTTRVSVNSSALQATGSSYVPSISAGGIFVVFRSGATNLVAGDTNGVDDFFVHDRVGGKTTRVNVDSAGTQANARGLFPAISADGRFVVFDSGATNLVAGDTNGVGDIFRAEGPANSILTRDSDLDGLTDAEEVNTYSTDPLDSDSDTDGLLDGLEVNTFGTDPLDSDSDDDGLTDAQEVNLYHTDPHDSDSDNDGLTDDEEVNTHRTDPLDSDSDNDGLTDGDEVNTYTTDPLDPDTDGDGLKDDDEVNWIHTDPLDSDSDTDGLLDGQEVNTFGTDPLDSDTVNDGYSDADEIAAGTDPRDSASYPFPWEIFMPAILHGGNNQSSSP